MVFGKSKCFASGKASQKWRARSAVQTRANESAAHLEAADELIELSVGREVDRGETSTEALVPKKAKEAGRPAVPALLEQAQRSKWNSNYYKRKLAFFARPPPYELAEADAAYSKTKTGKLRKDTIDAIKSAKKRVVAKIGDVMATFGDKAQQGRALKDYAASAGIFPSIMSVSLHAKHIAASQMARSSPRRRASFPTRP